MITNSTRNQIKKSILKCLTEDFKNNQAIFNKSKGWPVFHDTDLSMVMDKVVKGLEFSKTMYSKDFTQNMMSLAPFVEENFITFPLFMEGIYLPFVNIWGTFSDKKVAKYIPDGYDWQTDEYNPRYDTRCFSVCPKFKRTEDGGFTLEKEDWTIEEMVQIVCTIKEKCLTGQKKKSKLQEKRDESNQIV